MVVGSPLCCAGRGAGGSMAVIRCAGRRWGRVGRPARPGRRRTRGRWRWPPAGRRRWPWPRARSGSRWRGAGGRCRARPAGRPRAPPVSPSTDASKRNWRRMSVGVAPSALRRPISRIRSVTDTSMMFITPMPPTSREMPAMPPSRMVRVRSTEVAVETQRLLGGDGEVGVGGVWRCRAGRAARRRPLGRRPKAWTTRWPATRIDELSERRRRRAARWPW